MYAALSYILALPRATITQGDFQLNDIKTQARSTFRRHFFEDQTMLMKSGALQQNILKTRAQ